MHYIGHNARILNFDVANYEIRPVTEKHGLSIGIMIQIMWKWMPFIRAARVHNARAERTDGKFWNALNDLVYFMGEAWRAVRVTEYVLLTIWHEVYTVIWLKIVKIWIIEFTKWRLDDVGWVNWKASPVTIPDNDKDTEKFEDNTDPFLR